MRIILCFVCLFSGESVSQEMNGVEGISEPEMAAEPVGPDQSLPVSSGPEQLPTVPTSITARVIIIFIYFFICMFI